MNIEFKQEKPTVIEAWEKESKDGAWKLSYNRKDDGKCQYWLFNYNLMLGAHADTEQDALPAFAMMLQKHIDRCVALLNKLEEKEEK